MAVIAFLIYSKLFVKEGETKRMEDELDQMVYVMQETQKRLPLAILVFGVAIIVIYEFISNSSQEGTVMMVYTTAPAIMRINYGKFIGW